MGEDTVSPLKVSLHLLGFDWLTGFHSENTAKATLQHNKNLEKVAASVAAAHDVKRRRHWLSELNTYGVLHCKSSLAKLTADAKVRVINLVPLYCDDPTHCHGYQARVNTTVPRRASVKVP